MKKWLITLLLLVRFCCLGTMAGAAEEFHLIRLHVIANSDSCHDQHLKLKIRDLVLSELTELQEIKDIKLAQEYILAKQEKITKMIRAELAGDGEDYSISVGLVTSKFPTRRYSNELVLPAGEYLALKVIIGAGQGANWWCVLYPPICHGDWVKEKKHLPVEEQDAAPVFSEKTTAKAGEGRQKQLLKLIGEIGRDTVKLIIRVWSV
ncbi:MAG: stage II sporulation protein R [Peptococcaceae bacterium]